MASIPILLFPIKLARKFRSLTPLARRILKLRPGLQSEMEAAQLLEPPEKYIIAFIFSSLIWGVLIFLLTFMMAYNIQLETMERSLIMSAPMGIVFFFVFFFLHLIYPSIISRKVAETADRQLIYVLRDMWVQATSGVSLHRILQNISRAGYV